MTANGEIDPVTLEQLERLARSHPRSGREAQAKASALRTLERLASGWAPVGVAAVSAGLVSAQPGGVRGAGPGPPGGASGGSAADVGDLARLLAVPRCYRFRPKQQSGLVAERGAALTRTRKPRGGRARRPDA